MQLKRHLLLTLGVLVSLNMLVAFAAIGLFGRMGPAIARIMKENDRTIEAAEEMLFVLAEAGGRGVNAAARQRFERAMALARANVTEKRELPVLERMAQGSAAALGGDPQGTRQLLADLRQLMSVNRGAMGAADLEAQRLGRSGAWGAVFLGVFSFVIALVVLRRFERQLVAPLVELHDVLLAAHGGDAHRRCRQFSGPQELQRVLALVNEVLDARGPDEPA